MTTKLIRMPVVGSVGWQGYVPGPFPFGDASERLASREKPLEGSTNGTKLINSPARFPLGERAADAVILKSFS